MGTFSEGLAVMRVCFMCVLCKSDQASLAADALCAVVVPATVRYWHHGARCVGAALWHLCSVI